MSISGHLRELQRDGIDLVAILGGDTTLAPDQLREILRKLPRGAEEKLYSELLYHLTLQRYPEEEARRLWDLVLRHKERLARQLGRNVGFRVALLDYFTNKQQLLRGVRIISSDRFEELLNQIDTDDLTQVYNRRYFMEQLNRELQRARRYGSKVSLLLVDVDNFKLYNDTHGHVAGDAALRKIASALATNARVSDLVCRYGGDEFAIICPRTVKHDALTLAERLRNAVAELDLRPKLRGAEPVTLSVGVATFPDDAEESLALIEQADRSLFAAKQEAEKLASFQREAPR